MAKIAKIYTVTETPHRDNREHSITGTLEYLVDAYAYSLEVCASCQHEKGNKKINRNPKNIASLVNNLDSAKTNAAANGYSGVIYSFKEVQS